MGKQNRKYKQKKHTMADKADRHKLYEDTVQCVDSEIDFVDATYTQLTGRQAKSVREDFCGTFAASCEWVSRREDNTAVGVDIDKSVQDWGSGHNLAKLDKEQQRRVSLVTDDVMTAKTDPVDIVLAMNFSYWYFKKREQLREYYKCAHAALVDGGIFFLDCFGGYESFEEMEEEREEDGYTYIWDQHKYNPITGDILCHIHFKFPDGSKMKKAFSYDWRLWTLPEIREILEEAGFSRVTVYWDMSDDDDDNDYKASLMGEADAGWLAYIAAEK